jgi:hypothetical protein
MNLRKYYEEVKQVREKLESEFVYLTTSETPNGGVEGRVFEVAADTAARMLVDRVARLSTEDEVAAYLVEAAKLRHAAQEEQMKSRLRVSLVQEPQFEFYQEEKSSQRTETKTKNRG